MKKYNTLIIIAFALFLPLSLYSVGLIANNLHEASTSAELSQHIMDVHSSKFEENSVLFTPFVDEDMLPNLYTTLNEIIGAELEGISSLNNSITLGNIPDIKVVDPFLFNEDYLVLEKGRMPVPQQENETIEVLLGSIITSSDTNEKYDIGTIFNAGFQDITTGKSIMVRFEVVGIVDRYYSFPYPTPNVGNITHVSLIIPDISNYVDIELLPERYEALYLTFTEKADITEVTTRLQGLGNVFAVPKTKDYLSGNIDLKQNFQDSETIKAISIFILIGIIYTVLAFAFFSRRRENTFIVILDLALPFASWAFYYICAFFVLRFTGNNLLFVPYSLIAGGSLTAIAITVRTYLIFKKRRGKKHDKYKKFGENI